jgi:hypothetical protein
LPCALAHIPGQDLATGEPPRHRDPDAAWKEKAKALIPEMIPMRKVDGVYQFLMKAGKYTPVELPVMNECFVSYLAALGRTATLPKRVVMGWLRG